MALLTDEEIIELRDNGHVCVHPKGSLAARKAQLCDLRSVYEVEEKAVYYTVIYIVRERHEGS
jgi:hypothetical protein